MADAKLEIKVGAVSFTGEGPGDWLAKQLDKVLAKLPELTAIQGQQESDVDNDSPDESDSGKPQARKMKKQTTTLAAFLKDKKAATGNQQRKFLATAEWLHNGGTKRLFTKDVTNALSEHSQGKLTNPGQCLINLAKAGSVVREGKQFYVTEEGRTELSK